MPHRQCIRRSLSRGSGALRVVAIAAFVGVGGGCGEVSIGLSFGLSFGSFEPVWITASWSGGAKGPPNERIDRQPTDWQGLLCPASSVLLTNHAGQFAGLNVINDCTITVTYAICATKGSPPQPEFGLQPCALDPFDTPLSRLTIITVNPGSIGAFIDATQDLSIELFYCSDETELSGPPLKCR